MPKLLKALLAGFLSATLAACSCGTPSSMSPTSQTVSAGVRVSDEEFESFLDDYVISTCEESYLAAHHYFVHPEDYGVDLSRCKVTLGNFILTSEEKEEIQDRLEKLQGWNPDSLSKTNRQIYQQMLWQTQLDSEMSDPKFDYLTNVWSTTSSVPMNLVSIFTEFQLFEESDLQPLVELIEDVPRYADEAMDYTRKQADLGFFAIQFDETLQSIADTLKTREDSPITHALYEEIESLNLGDQKTAEWKEKVNTALQESFFPAFETMRNELNKLKDKNKPMAGMSSYENGKEYYELLLRSYSGTNLKPDEIRREVQLNAYALLDDYAELTDKSGGEYTPSPKTSFKNVSEIIPFLEERYPASFPIVDTMDYEIMPLPDEQSTEGICAYFVVPPIDSTRPYEIRYNRRDYGENASSLDLYHTFAHEGIPGHMYQEQYMHEHATHPVQYMIGNIGVTEAYANYAANQTLAWLNVNENDLKYWELTDGYSNCTILLMDLQINYDGMTRTEFVSSYGEVNAGLYDRLTENPCGFFGYYFGSMELEDLREITQEALGDEFDDVRFNQAILDSFSCNFEIIKDNVQDYIDSVRMSVYGDDSSKSSSGSSLPATKSNKGKDRSRQKTPLSKDSATPAPIEGSGADFE